ncbi:MAG: hypothetical protein R3282_08890, partial [Rhodothermales bacterium]|nr:hypothetical protein [Rhodothermales bacterium]
MKLGRLPILFVAVVGTGCSAFSIPETPAVSSPVAPVWNVGEIRRHLSFMHDRSVRGRVDGTVGYGVAASYAGEQMEEYGLQPATEGDFRLLYTTPRNLVRASRFRIGVTDTVNLLPGIDFVADGRTGNAFVAVSGVGIADSAEAWQGPAIPLLLRDLQTGRQLELLRDLGVPIVLVEHDDLTPRPARRAIAGIGVMNLTRRSTDRILEGAQSASALGQGVLRLRRPVRIEVIAEFDRTASGVNVVGYVPGKDP